ncbi:MAG: peptidylprolyl isomerase [Bacteriovoracaceae bacterium]
MKKTIALVGLFALSMAQAQDPVVATVNGEKITKSTLDQSYQQNLLFLSNKKVTKEKVLDDLISRQLGIQKAKTSKLDKDPVIAAKMDDILYHAQISKDLEDKLKKIPEVSDADVKEYYATNKEYRTAHILYRVRAQPTPDEVQKAYEQSMQIFNELQKSPDKFAEYANKYSQTTTAPTGGDIGFQPPTRLAPEYFEAISGKNVGFISKPVRTQFGFHIIKVLAVKDYDKITKDMYKKIIYDIRRDKILDDYFASLRKSAAVNINKDLLK